MGYMGDLSKIYPKPYSIYLRGTIGFRMLGEPEGWLATSNIDVLPG